MKLISSYKPIIYVNRTPFGICSVKRRSNLVFMKKKKSILISSILAGIVLLFVGYHFFQLSHQDEEKTVMQKLSSKPELVQNYKKIQELEAKRKADPSKDAGFIVSIGFEWKSLGDLTQDPYFYEKALALYNEGIQKYGSTNIAYYWNAGKVAEALKRFDQAEFDYREAIRISPAYNQSYHNLAELYIYQMKKDDKDILSVFAEGLKGTSGDASLYLSQCSFLRMRNRTQDAIDCYDILSKSYPNNPQYKQVLQELKKSK